jgi:hypothetical protein
MLRILVHRFLSPWWRRRQVPPKRRFLQEPHGVTTQKTPFFRSKEKRNQQEGSKEVQFLLLVNLRPRRWWLNVPPKCQMIFIGSRVMSQRPELLITTARRTPYRNAVVLQPSPSLEHSSRLVWITPSVFISLGFATVIVLHSEIVSLATEPQTGAPSLLLSVSPVTGRPSYTSRHRILFSLPSGCLRATVPRLQHGTH